MDITTSFNEQLAELHIFVEQMQATSSSLEKVEILKQQPEFIQKVLEYTYNPFKQYHVTSKTCIKNKDIITGDQAAKNGKSIPFTPKALKKKLRA